MNRSTPAADEIGVLAARACASRSVEASVARPCEAQGANHWMPAASEERCSRQVGSARAWARRGPRLIALWAVLMPSLAAAQASPFLTGATALESNILAWLTPVAVILIMVLGAMAMANRISWAWCIAAILGIAIAFGAPQIVTWVRGMFGV